MELAYALDKESKGRPLVAAAPIRLTMSTAEMEAPGFDYNPLTQSTIGTMGSSYCSIDESIGAPFNSTTDSKSDD